ncbi:ATP-binding cassette domain-containing protein [Leptolyngbya sp. 15MV]|nr:ATP-binding cassette domain-containing protein [Leptolyngbya sp. 15MV]
MARLLLSGADVLLLDEPTNHLDVDAVEWLEEFLQTYDGAYVVISHDRYFLDRTTDRIVELENGKAVNYKGNYSKYVVEREIRREQQMREYENQRSLIEKTEEFIRRNIEGQKTKQAKSRRNMLERLERVEAVSAEKHGGSFGLKQVERTGNNVLVLEDLSVGYGERILASNINISVHRGEVLGIIGANGTGKTTLLKTLLGQIREVTGEVRWGTKVNIGYYAQNLDELYQANEVIQELRRVAPNADNGDLRSFLARFLFFGDDVFKRVGDLSGGEKGRLALAKLIYSRKNVLILDEPTNHLDIPAREALEDALAEYDGTIITVSHDRFFLDKISTQILSFEKDGKIENYPGNYTDFHTWRNARRREVDPRTDDRLNEPIENAVFDATASGGDVEAIGLRREQDLGQRIGRDGDHQQPVQLGILPAREHRRGHQPQQRRPDAREQQRQQHPVEYEVGGPLAFAQGQPLRQPALLAHRADQRQQLDHHQRRGEAAQRVGAVEPPGDEQERQPRDQPQQETEEVGPSALRQRGDIALRCVGAHAAGSCSARSGRARSSPTTSVAGAPCSRR